MRCIALLLTVAAVLVAFVLGVVASYVFGSALCVLLLVGLAVWVVWVLFDCWFLSDLDDVALALVSARLVWVCIALELIPPPPSPGPMPPPTHA
jgi:hypothetical protein